MTASVTGDITGTITLQQQEGPVICGTWYGEKELAWSCDPLVPNVVLGITVRCKASGTKPSDVEVSASISPSNQCNNFVNPVTDPDATCEPFSGSYHFDFDSPFPGCACTDGIDVDIDENVVP